MALRGLPGIHRWSRINIAVGSSSATMLLGIASAIAPRHPLWYLLRVLPVVGYNLCDELHFLGMRTRIPWGFAERLALTRRCSIWGSCIAS